MMGGNRLALGTMRFLDKRMGLSDVQELLQYSILAGVNAFHISSEYSSYPLFSDAVRRLGAKINDADFIAKVASPHFDEPEFCGNKLEDRIDALLRDFKADRISVVQWMWRLNPLDDDLRCSKMIEQLELIKHTFDYLVNKGKVGDFACFPYSSRFQELVYELDICKRHVNYLNFWERDLVDGGLGWDAIALRPFLAGKVNSLTDENMNALNSVWGSGDESAAFHCLAFPLSSPKIKFVAVGLNSIAQIDGALSIASRVKADESVFMKYLELVGSFDSK